MAENPIRRLRGRASRHDVTAGVVLGVQSVPDGLATGLLAGINPLAGLYGYMVGTATGALFASSAFMAVQGTGAMAMVMADVPGLRGDDAARRLAMLVVLTGAAMLVAGLLRLGSLLRFVSNAVMVGFINAVGVNIVLGQLSNLTGYDAEGANRVIRAVRTLFRPDLMDVRTVAIGLATMAIIVVLGRTRVGETGLVIGIVVSSAAVALLGWSEVAILDDLGVSLDSLPGPVMPEISAAPALIVPALALAFVGLVQGAGISANFPNPDGSSPDASRDFVGQGAANVASGLLRGMPVGGSVSATSLNKAAGARSRASLLIAALVMALVIVAFGGVVGGIAMPALAGLLILIGLQTIKPADLASVWHTGPMQRAVMVSTFVLTMIAPLQYAVMVGVASSIVLHVVRQSNQVTIRRQVFDADGYLTEVDPPEVLPAGEVVVLQPYGSLFFAAAPVIETMLPQVADSSTGSVVLIRLRGRTDFGTTFIDVLRRYALALDEVGSALKLVSVSDRILEQLAITGLAELLGTENVYRGDDRVGHVFAQANADAATWVESHR